MPKSIKELSKTKPVVIFKHSTTCSISATALDRFERKAVKNTISDDINFFKLDLLAHRDISNKIATLYNVQHESPQLLLIVNEKAVYVESHYGIDYDDLIANILA